jgi:hypothetical protein
MNKISELERQIALLQEKVQSLQKELERFTLRHYVCTLEPGKQMFWVEVKAI